MRQRSKQWTKAEHGGTREGARTNGSEWFGHGEKCVDRERTGQEGRCDRIGREWWRMEEQSTSFVSSEGGTLIDWSYHFYEWIFKNLFRYCDKSSIKANWKGSILCNRYPLTIHFGSNENAPQTHSYVLIEDVYHSNPNQSSDFYQNLPFD